DLLGRLQVVARDRFLQVAAGTGVLAGVDVDDGHGLGTIDDQRAAGRQEHLAVQPLEDLLVDPPLAEQVARPGVPVQPLQQVRRDVLEVHLHLVIGVRALDDQLPEVLVEQVPDHPDHQVGLLVQQYRGAALAGLGSLGPIGSLVTWTRTESPDFNACSIERARPSRPVASQFTSPAYSTALRPRPMSMNAASMLGSTFCTLPRYTLPTMDAALARVT